MQSSVGSRAFQNARLQKRAKKQADVLLPAAVKAYREGRHQETQSLCRQILQDLPQHVGALHLLGVSERDCGRFDQAVLLLTRAVDIDPRAADAQSDLGVSLSRLGRHEDARARFERAIALKPNFPAALTHLGNALMSLFRFEEAIAAHDRAIALKPDHAEAYANRGMALMFTSRNGEAAQNFDRALSLQPRLLTALFGKGVASMNLRDFDAALAALNAALAINPKAAAVIAQRGRAYQELGRFAEAEADFDAALALEPRLEEALCGKAAVTLVNGNIAPAISVINKVLEQNPNSEIAWTLLGVCAAAQGDTAAAIDHYDRALAIRPNHEDAITKKIFALDFLPDTGVERLQEARRYWWEAIGSRLERRSLGVRNIDPDRRLVVGYVSSDFRDHSAAFAFLPILRHHDRAKFEIVAYSCSPLKDAKTELCRSLVDRWVDASLWGDDRLADQIQADKVDILVDLSGHSAGHRLTMFAHKPAPIQVSAVGSVTGTGLPVMDYLLADAVTIPAEVRHLFAEKIYDLPSLITIEPPPTIPPSPLPMLQNGHVTFGAFNRIDKMSEPAIGLWSKLMAATPGSIIVVKNHSMGDALLRDRLIARFVAHGIAADRIRCEGKTTRQQHLAMFAEIDISLDPFPQNGGISTWESLQMGVPVVTKLGSGPSARAGGAIVKALGLDEWVAEDDEGYLATALNFCSRPAELAALRAELPAMVSNSAAGNNALYTQHVEKAYRRFWQDYCLQAPIR
ncbi:putative O-linked N-acetylglucosamine transferase, SPINDLY family; TPR domain protein [Bradyrhizobium sp. ORS 375]|uniref:O-linked N-acetylglucosamine transferase, SPINDLY family protein n=1 Tax=Bradyrhizobium sp. (strain ORS 375) TaxID=566679 RepID=UPI0002407A8A|nr:tetratricopeptide repeat protein [Bradyrhizobium sp. ORS 375]CCD93767.1 putative O-linked N-acetylglucosamine transferase, SPINDLY family; TPR domain protein [Bradyrhizobium sp. ORS 375]